MLERTIALGLQKPTGKTNLGEETAKILSAGGLQWDFPDRVDFASTNINRLEIVAMRNGDLTRACARGEIDLAIVGEDKYWDYYQFNPPVVVQKLGFSKCSVKLGVRSDFPYKESADLAGQTVATSYVRGSARWFQEQGIPIKILEYEGSEEMGPARIERTRAVGCIAISASGKSMESNKMKIVATILDSEAVLIANPAIRSIAELEETTWRLLRTIMTGIWRTQLPMLEVQSVFPNLDDPEIARMMRVIYGTNWRLPHPPYKA